MIFFYLCWFEGIKFPFDGEEVRIDGEEVRIDGEEVDGEEVRKPFFKPIG